MIPDRLHESLGRYRVDVGVSPEEDSPWMRDRFVADARILVQFYDLWTDQIDPKTQVNPYRITGFADRFKRALKATGQAPATDRAWYFDVDRTSYPNDPTGNKTRFHMEILVRGNNSNLIETTS